MKINHPFNTAAACTTRPLLVPAVALVLALASAATTARAAVVSGVDGINLGLSAAGKLYGAHILTYPSAFPSDLPNGWLTPNNGLANYIAQSGLPKQKSSKIVLMTT